MAGLNATSLDRSEHPSLSGWALQIQNWPQQRERWWLGLFIRWNGDPNFPSDQNHKCIVLFFSKSHLHFWKSFILLDLISRLIKCWSRNNNDFLHRKMCMLEMFIECFTSINLSSKPAEKWEYLLIIQIQTKMLFLWVKMLSNFVCKDKVLCDLLHILPLL